MPTRWARGPWRCGVPLLADLQRSIRHAVVQGDTAALDPLLVGGRYPQRRLAIHQRHYEASLMRALLQRFPATGWLAGSIFVTEAARQFVRERPPGKPCMAEYGEDFPAFLSERPGAAELPYLRAFVELEWHLARLSWAVTLPPLTRTDLSAFDPETLSDVTIRLQPGVHYLHAGWAVDDLMRLYLTDRAPEQFSLRADEVWLELRGGRGDLQMRRLARDTFAFRAVLAAGQSLGDAAMAALDVNATFEAGQALMALVTSGVVVDAHRERVVA